ncbi:MAG: NADH-quinone oxidoreductase subunit N [Planctomycetes bacterium]|nr:NADH-quinone oxidoreductase subunit N [Planctomycetota bacterium]
MQNSIETARRIVAEGMSGIIPEILLCALVCVLLLADLFIRGIKPRTTAWIAVLGFVACGAALIARNGVHAEVFGWQQADGMRGMLLNDQFAWFFQVFVLATALVCIPMAMDHAAFRARRMGEFYALLAAATLGMFLMASATNLLMAYLGIEFASMASYLATAYDKRDRAGSEGGLKYVIYGSVASGIMIYGLSLIYGMTGSLHYTDIAQALHVSAATEGQLLIAAILIFGGFAYKMAAVPMHFWCPDVYEGAPTPFTAYLSVASKAAGFAVFVRFLAAFTAHGGPTFTGFGGMEFEASFGWPVIVAAAAALSMTVGNLGALWQTNVKRMLAYSSIAQAGYLLMAVAVYAAGHDKPNGGDLAPLVFYFIAYFFMNLGAFHVISVVGSRTGAVTVSDFAGLGRRAPWMAFGLGVCMLSLLGMPPTGGFVGKMQLLQTAVENNLVWLAVLAGINTAISAFYYFKLLKSMYLEKSAGGVIQSGSANLAVLALLVAPLFVLGLAFSPIAEFSRGFGF